MGGDGNDDMSMTAGQGGAATRHDLSRFALRDMIECGRSLRQAAGDAATMESAARAVVKYLYENLVDTEAGPEHRAGNCALVRCFKTHRFGQLPDALAEAARAAMTQRDPRADLPCLTLLATAGELPEWNDRRRSRGHAAIPLESVEIVERAPMIASLIRQMGLGIEAALYPDEQLILDADQHAFNVFHVEHARGDASIPAQREFVERYGIVSVLGFGGLLPSGDLFSVILFSRTRITRQTARLFRTIALGVKLALLPHARGRIFDEVVDEDELAAGDDAGADEVRRKAMQDEQIRSETATLQLLITALEDAALDQTTQLQVAYNAVKGQGELLQRTAERLRLAQQTGRIASWEWDIASDAVIWDEGTARTYGRPPEEMASMQQISTYIHEEDLPRARAEMAAATGGGGEYRSTFRVKWPDRSVHWIQAFGETIYAGEKAVRVVGVNLDVTERKIAEQALIRNEKLAAVGRLASSIAHEINNPLEAVTNLLYLAAGSSGLEEAQRYVAIANVELRRVSAIATQTLRFNKQATRATNITCLDLIGSALAIYQGRIDNSNITVWKKKRAKRPVRCFEGEIRQVISNLIVNAIDAMPNGGRLLLRSRDGRDWRSEKPGLVITVADTGTGMPMDVKEKVFEAFYTTKGIGGTGLGLWISKEILERHRGTLTVRSSQRTTQSGTVFCIFLPSDAVSV